MKRRDFIKLSATSAAMSSMIPGIGNAYFSERNLQNKPVEAKYLWYKPEGYDRNDYAIFRNTFEISGKVTEAKLNVFADTTYQLFINGEFIEFGPVRFDPRFPLFDSHDLSTYLVKGKNVIAIQAKYFGMRTYKSIASQAGMVAWGSIQHGGEETSLLSTPDNWKCIENKAYSRLNQKISFALDTKDVFDQRLEEKNWKNIDFDDSKWPAAIELKKQDSWGIQEPRNIPFMSNENIELEQVRNALPIAGKEELYSFTVQASEYYDFERPYKDAYFAYRTYIYSPIDQTVQVGTFWGENYLNGVLLERGLDDTFKSLRLNQLWKFKKGWNTFFGTTGAYSDAIHKYFAFPKKAGLIVSLEKKEGSENIFERSELHKKVEFDKTIGKIAVPFAADEDLSEAGGWIKIKRTEGAVDPSTDLSWEEYEEQVEKISPENLIGHTFKKETYPYGFSLLMELPHTHLVFPVIHFSGVKGAIVDIGYSEYLNEDNQHIELLNHYTGSDRIYCSEDEIHWHPSQPRGMWYIKLSVRNITNDITIKDLSFRSADYPVEEKGSFKCSDPLLTEIWQMGARAQQVNMEDAYVDCVGRERGMYLRDTIIQYHVNLATYGDHKLMHRCLQLYGQSPDSTGKYRAVFPNVGDYTISDFALNMPEGYLAYYENTGDKNKVEEDWDALLKNIAWFHKLADEREDGLLDAEWHKKADIDAHYGGFHGDLQTVEGYHDITGIHGTFSLTYLISMKATKKLAEVLGKKEDASKLQKRIDPLSENVQKFWDDTKGAFADNLDKKIHSIHVNLFAIRSGIATEEQKLKIQQFIRQTYPSLFVNGYDPYGGAHFSPNFGFYILDGLYKAGLSDMAEKYIREGWGWALAKGYKTTPEYFRESGSKCHAWSAGPTYYMSQNILGVHFPEPPNTDKVVIKIDSPSVTWAEGTYPHPKGQIYVKWHIEDGIVVYDKVDGPEGVTIELIS